MKEGAAKLSSGYEMLAAEYRRMAEVEARMWWYTSLHADLLDTIRRAFPDRRDMRILDAGCGTGGFLRHLRGQGYHDLVGLDIADAAVEHSRRQGFAVIQGSIADPAALDAAGPADVIVSMDVICSLPDEEERVRFFREAWRLLKPGGLLIVQTPAFSCLGGIHDRAVRVNKRYTARGMRGVLERAGITGYRLRYRLVLLTPLIFVVRTLQRRRLRLGDAVVIESDVKMPPSILNALLYKLQKLEDRWLPLRPFGTSLQILARKE